MAARSWLKAVAQMRHHRVARFLPLFGASSTAKSFDYRGAVGTGTQASVIMAPVQWIQRAFPEARAIVQTRRGDEWEEAADHPLTALLENPNPFYTGVDLWMSTIFSFATAGNAYWIKVRNRMGRPTELWYVPHWLIEPSFPDDGSVFIDGYQYKPGGETVSLEPDDVVHFRHGVDPINPRKGISPLDSAIKEIWTDMESGSFVASLLRNNAVPGVILSPDSGETIDTEDAAETKRELKMRFTGDNRGDPLVMSSRTKVDRLAWSPQEMDLSVARNVAEERVCALLGIPSSVVGFGTGMEQTRVGATMTELRRLAWMNGILPLQRHFALELSRSLPQDFRGQGRRRVTFDNSEVGALQEDRNEQFTRATQAVSGGWLTVASAKRMVGLEPAQGDDVYLRGIAVTEVPVGESQPTGVRSRAIEGRKAFADRKDEHSLLELRIIEQAPRVGVSEAQQRFMDTLADMEARQAESFAKTLTEFFEAEAERITEIAAPLVRDAKQITPEDELLARQILEEASVVATPAVWVRNFEAFYLEVGEQVASVSDVVGLATDLPDPVARAVMQAGGRRAGLVDLKRQARANLFTALTEARAEGEGADAIVERIRDQLPRGPWSSPEIRARVIARTETLHAQRVSVLEKSKAAGVEQFRIFDARLGPTDEVCEAMDGRVVSRDVAEELMAQEHPAGSRSLTPVFPEADT